MAYLIYILFGSSLDGAINKYHFFDMQKHHPIECAKSQQFFSVVSMLLLLLLLFQHDIN